MDTRDFYSRVVHVIRRFNVREKLVLLGVGRPAQRAVVTSCESHPRPRRQEILDGGDSKDRATRTATLRAV